MYTVPQLDDFSPAALDSAAATLIAECETEARDAKDDTAYKLFRDRWMARKNGILTQINDGWLKAAPKDAKRDVGARVNSLKSAVEEISASA